MKTVSIGQLRQNPAPAIEEVEHGHGVEITRYRKVIARIVPAHQKRQILSGSAVMDMLKTLPTTADPGWRADIADARAEDDAQWQDPWETP